MRVEDIHRLEMFLCRVNKVTAPFRHGGKIPNDALVVLSNDQIEMEQWVKDRRAEIAVELPTVPQHTQPVICPTCGKAPVYPYSGIDAWCPRCCKWITDKQRAGA